MWEAYDTLEALSRERHLAQRSWQVGVDEYRQSVEINRQFQSGPMTYSDRDRYPLGVRLEQVIATRIEHRNRDWGVALERAARFGRLIDEQPSFKACLSIPQQVSWTLLKEWWSAKYQDLSLSKAARASLKAAASFPSLPWRLPREYPMREQDEIEQSSLIDKSLYHSAMFRLFAVEFHPKSWQPYIKEPYFENLQSFRRQAVRFASIQKLGYTSYATIMGFSDLKATPYIGVDHEACPWLRKTNDDQGMPFFLWDVSDERTVIVGDLVEKPVYWCVSHTWGRWRKEPSIQIDGVPWLVPQNDRFIVSDLPKHLKQLQQSLGEPLFVWIDLFCIPQHESFKANEEINRQALIFQNASRCLSWQNDVIGWAVTRDTLTWLGLSFLYTTSVPGLYDVEHILSDAHAKSQRCCELFPAKFPAGIQGRDELENIRRYEPPAAWFSSLWTLQEAVLCPDLVLVERNWTQLRDLSGCLIPLSTICRLAATLEKVRNNGTAYKPYDGTVQDYFNRGEEVVLRWPLAARQLMDMEMHTQMNNLFDASLPMSILIAANLRKCTGNRAPAIMSATGVIGWYDPARADVKNLVLKSYPLAFVREAASKIGAMFYATWPAREKIPKRYEVFRGKHRGSMLPFSGDTFEYKWEMPSMENYVVNETENHPAVSSWRINLDGSVNIRFAGIFASSKSPTRMNLEMLAMITPKTMPAANTFQEWISHLPKNSTVYAVSLLRDANFHHGIILLRINNKMMCLLESVVRVGVFQTQIRDFPESSFVNWLAI